MRQAWVCRNDPLNEFSFGGRASLNKSAFCFKSVFQAYRQLLTVQPRATSSSCHPPQKVPIMFTFSRSKPVCSGSSIENKQINRKKKVITCRLNLLDKTFPGREGLFVCLLRVWCASYLTAGSGMASRLAGTWTPFSHSCLQGSEST